MRRTWSQHSDLIIFVGLIGVLLIGTIVALSRWHITPQMWQTDEEQDPLVDFDELDNIGTRDYIIPIDTPKFETVAQALIWLHPNSPVVVVDSYSDVRAYPLLILLHHEIVNDVIGEISIAVTFCPGCNSAIVYSRHVDGKILRMGVSGYVHNSGFIMVDDESHSYWQQFTGQAINGMYTGTVLEIIPSAVVGFEAFAEQYPDGVVLAGDGENPRNYDMNPYIGYDSNPQPMLSTGTYDPRLLPLQRVLASVVDGVPVAYDFEMLENEGVVHDMVNDEPIVVFWKPGAVSVLDGATINNSRDVGQAAIFKRTLEDGRELTFHNDYGRIFDNETNSEWNIFGEAIYGELDGTRLQRYQCFPHFWFAWSSTHPDTLLYNP